MAFHHPVLVGEVDPVMKGSSEILHGVEGCHTQKLLLEGPDKPLGYTISLWRPDKSWTGRPPHESSVLKCVHLANV